MPQPLNDTALDQLFRTARTSNGYLPGEVTEADIHAIYDLLKMGPTSANQQSGRFVWLLSEAGKEKLAALASGTNGDKIRKAPASVIVAMDENFHEELPWLFPHTDAKSWFAGDDKLATRQAHAFRNSSLQGGYFILAARALGWDVGPMSGFDNAAVDAAFFGDTPSVKSNFIATFGRGDPSTIFDRSPRPAFDKFNRIA